MQRCEQILMLCNFSIFVLRLRLERKKVKGIIQIHSRDEKRIDREAETEKLVRPFAYNRLCQIVKLSTPRRRTLLYS